MVFTRPSQVFGMHNCVENGKMEWMDEEEILWMKQT